MEKTMNYAVIFTYSFDKGVNMKRCELNGCVYNENGTCKYDEALIKVASATACYENFSEEE